MGRLDDGRPAFLVRRNDTEDMARAILAAYDEELLLVGKELVDWCCHTADYAYRNGCAEWCDRPSARFVWVGRYPDRAAADALQEALGG